MKILVTGAEGFMGKNLMEALKLRDNCEIFPFDIHTPEAELDRFL